jgi:alkylation response protein AidB-like acyl-CoA dehydrogenase
MAMTSTYFGSSSMSLALRSARSAAIRVVPEPQKGSSTMSRPFDEFRMARSTNSTGFMVGCGSFLTGFSTN